MMMARAIIDGEVMLRVVANMVWMLGPFIVMDVEVLAWESARGTMSHGARALLHFILLHCFFILVDGCEPSHVHHQELAMETLGAKEFSLVVRPFRDIQGPHNLDHIFS